MLIDCDTCLMRRSSACTDCVVGVLISAGPVEVDESEQEALEHLADAGLVPRLRLVATHQPDPPRSAAG